MIEFVKDEDLIYHIKEYDVVLVGTNIRNTLGNGFQKKIAKSFPFIEEANNKTHYNDEEKLGKILYAMPELGSPLLCLCYIYKERQRPDLHPDAVDYDALVNCLNRINEEFKGKRIATTILGASPFEGGGNRDYIVTLLTSILTNVDLYIYDYEQKDYYNEFNERYRDIYNRYKNGVIDKEAYYHEKSKFIWEKNFGFYEPMPEGLTYRELTYRIKMLKNNGKVLLY